MWVITSVLTLGLFQPFTHYIANAETDCQGTTLPRQGACGSAQSNIQAQNRLTIGAAGNSSTFAQQNAIRLLADASPHASASFLVTTSPGELGSPSLAGSTLVVSDCSQPFEPCSVKVQDIQTGSSYSASTTYFGGEPRTDGVHVVWSDARNRTSTDPGDPLNNLDIYGANISDNTSFSITTAPHSQQTPDVYGNIVVWSDDRAGTSFEDAGDIYMYDLSSHRETLVSSSSHAEWNPVTNGKVIVWEDFSPTDQNGASSIHLYGYDIATGTKFVVADGKGNQSQPAISGNIVVYAADSASGENDIYAYDISTKKRFAISSAPGQQFSPSISGNIVAWADARRDPLGHGGGFQFVDIYGYDLASKKEFLIADGPVIHGSPSVSGNTVVWTEGPSSASNDVSIRGATIIAASGATPLPKPASPTSRTFPETGKVVSGLFLDYWNKNGGLAQQGLPISTVFNEKSDTDGKTYTVQYFERAVLEAHPENKPPYNVLLSQLGTFQYKQNYPSATSTPKPPPGALTGRVAYPSAFGDQAFEVYAIPVQGSKYYAAGTWGDTDTFYLSGVEPGSYYVVAYLKAQYGVPDTSGSAAAYTQAALCMQNGANGTNDTCTDHTLIPVTVHSGQTTTRIDAIDPNGNGDGQVVAPDRFPHEPDPAGRCQVFEPTNETVCGKFLEYWLSHGGLVQQGLPISTEMTEVSELNGKTYTVQYFERAVFEYHPENQPPYDVLLSQLGTFQYKQKYGAGK